MTTAKKKIELTVSGCDDYVDIEMDVTATQLDFLDLLAHLVNEKRGNDGCKPSMTVRVL
jgi:hypothetical protein